MSTRPEYAHRHRRDRRATARFLKLYPHHRTKPPAFATRDCNAARHTAATVLLILGIPDRAAMAIMGWSRSAMAALPAPHHSNPRRHRWASRRLAVGVNRDQSRTPGSQQSQESTNKTGTRSPPPISSMHELPPPLRRRKRRSCRVGHHSQAALSAERGLGRTHVGSGRESRPPPTNRPLGQEPLAFPRLYPGRTIKFRRVHIIDIRDPALVCTECEPAVLPVCPSCGSTALTR